MKCATLTLILTAIASIKAQDTTAGSSTSAPVQNIPTNCGSEHIDCTAYTFSNQTGCCHLVVGDNPLGLQVDPFLLDPVCTTFQTCRDAGYQVGHAIALDCQPNEANCVNYQKDGVKTLMQDMPCDCKYPLSILATYIDKDGKATTGLSGSNAPESTTAKVCSVMDFNPLSGTPERDDKDCTKFCEDCGCCALKYNNPLSLMKQTFEGFDFMKSLDISCAEKDECGKKGFTLGSTISGCTPNADGCIKAYQKNDILNETAYTCDCKQPFGVTATFVDGAGQETVTGKIVGVVDGSGRRSLRA